MIEVKISKAPSDLLAAQCASLAPLAYLSNTPNITTPISTNHGERSKRRSLSSRLLATLYSPELNPIERVWKRTRRNCVHNVYFSTLQALVDRVEQQFVNGPNSMKSCVAYAGYDPQIIMSLCLVAYYFPVLECYQDLAKDAVPLSGQVSTGVLGQSAERQIESEGDG